MKTITIIMGLFALAVNIMVGAIVPAYPQFNMYLNSAIIVVHTLLLLAVLIANLKDAFRISLGYIFSTICVSMLIWGFFVIPQFENNIPLIAMFAITLMEVLGLIGANYITNKVK